MGQTNEFLNRFRAVHIEPVTWRDKPLTYQEKRPYLECADGYRISIQASENHYCSPRLNGLHEYDEVELGFPTAADELINDYAEDPEDYTKTVYGYVPVDVVDQLLKKHGGIWSVQVGKTLWAERYYTGIPLEDGEWGNY